jgi:hypothetical protein
MTHYCEFPTFPDLNGGEDFCGAPACTKINGVWYCALHEDVAERLEAQASEEALDDLLD